MEKESSLLQKKKQREMLKRKHGLTAAPARRMEDMRTQRNQILAESDYMGNSDVTMTDAWKTYRQALRDITSQTPSDDTLSNINWPTKP